MRTLLAETAAGRKRSLEKAQRVIQPVWRGAWTRMRLKRFALDDDDDMVFEKVDVGAIAELGERNTREASRFATVLRNTMGGQSLFDVPDDVAPGDVGTEDARPQSMPMPGRPQRAAAMANMAATPPAGGGSMTGRLRASASATLTPHSPDSNGGSRRQSAPPGQQQQPGATEVDPEWGAGVAAQIKKRDAKQAKAKKEFERRSKLR